MRRRWETVLDRGDGGGVRAGVGSGVSGFGAGRARLRVGLGRGGASLSRPVRSPWLPWRIFSSYLPPVLELARVPALSMVESMAPRCCRTISVALPVAWAIRSLRFMFCSCFVNWVVGEAGWVRVGGG
ncbi:hypothetical protein BA895_16775 [Humibacillus sp. DSM 29435]|nr:hypothetical protein BA895_16775 [Humibacillus sp. DSM 29435]